MKLKVNEKEFTVKVADTDEKRRQGLIGIESIPAMHGLVLKYEEPVEIPITMIGMQFPLGIVHILDCVVQTVTIAEPDAPDDINIGQLSIAVLEVNVDDVHGIKEGDAVEWLGEKQEDGTIEFVAGKEEPAEGELHVLNDKGQVVSNVKGNERVFSRKDTSNMLSKAQRASDTKEDTHYSALGRTFVRVINKQDSQEPEYTDD